MNQLREIVLGAAIVGLGAMFGTGLYESIANAPNFTSGIPSSLEHARSFWKVSNPGHFFRVAAPATQLATLLALILSWNRPRGRRIWLVTAFLLIAAADVVTYAIHIPRNQLMFTSPLTASPEALQRAAEEWGDWNWVRVVLALLAATAALIAFSKREAVA